MNVRTLHAAGVKAQELEAGSYEDAEDYFTDDDSDLTTAQVYVDGLRKASTEPGFMQPPGSLVTLLEDITDEPVFPDMEASYASGAQDGKAHADFVIERALERDVSVDAWDGFDNSEADDRDEYVDGFIAGYRESIAGYRERLR
ncbi:MAG: hypothetical protein H0W30_16070 [Gemmatimonadaceae bacterium]|nr:hypothetical protein [Gemmatimonadaceae bacterium]